MLIVGKVVLGKKLGLLLSGVGLRYTDGAIDTVAQMIWIYILLKIYAGRSIIYC